MALPSISGFPAILASVCALVTLYAVFSALYNVFLHPLRKFPGPKWWAATRIPYTAAFLGGHSRRRILQLHEQYGEVVRIAPDQLSFLSPESWHAVYGVSPRGQENPKDPLYYRDLSESIIGAFNPDDHARMRRVLSPGFQPKALHAQEDLIRSHVELLIQRLRDDTAKTAKVDIIPYLSSFAFDVIGDLAFGESFDGLRDLSGGYHPWVALILQALKLGVQVDALLRIPVVSVLLQAALSHAPKEQLAQHRALARDKVERRMALQIPRHDLAEAMTKHHAGKEFSAAEVQANAEALIMAGADTVASALAGAIFLLATHPQCLAAAVGEVRAAFASPRDMDIRNTKTLSYLQAVVNEAMRIYPPVPGALLRVSPPGGTFILGQFVTGGTILSVGQWPVYHCASNFARPDEFLPDRWLGDPEFASDRREAFQPFGYGPRNCIGKSLANVEISLVLARVLFEFDIQAAVETNTWLDQDAYVWWDKPPMFLDFTRRRN